MKRRAFFTIISLGITFGLYFLYAYIIVPLAIFPPLSILDPSRRLDTGLGPGKEIESLSRRYTELLAPLFPDENDWRRKSPRVIVPNDLSGLFLFKGEPSLSANRREITLSACTVVIPSTDESLDEEERFRRGVVIETRDRATVQFRDAFSLTDVPRFSDFEKGTLLGEVQIRCAMKDPGPEDDFLLTTRDISFTRGQILANNEVFFRYGPHRAEGEGLRIEIAPDRSERGDESNPYRELNRVGNVGGGFSVEWISLVKLHSLQCEVQAAQLNNEPPEGGESDAPEKLNVEIRCENGVLFAPNPDEPAQWVGRFMEQVEAVVFHKTEKEDRLTCRNLYLYLVDAKLRDKLAEIAATFDGPKPKRMPSGNLTQLEPVRIKAVRSEEAQANIELPGEQVSAFGDEIVYDITRKRFILRSESEQSPVKLTRQTTEVTASALDYTAEEGNRFGSLLADQSGQLTTMLTDQNSEPTPFQVFWKDGLRIDPDPNDPNLIKLALQGDVRLAWKPFGEIVAKEADFWGLLPPNTESASPKAANANTGGKGGLSAMRPRSAQFRGAIQMTSERGICRLREELTIRFQETGPISDLAPENGAASSDTPTGGLGSGSILGTVSSSTFQMDGGRLDLWVRYDPNHRSEVSRMVIRQNIRVVETAADGGETLRIEGDDAQIERPESKHAAVELVGRPASFHGHGLDLAGYNIRVDREKNMFSVVGRGKLSIQPKEEAGGLFGTRSAETGAAATQTPAEGIAQSQPKESPSAQPVDVRWSRAMTFDGKTLSFQGDETDPVFVQRKPSMELRAPLMRFSLQRAIEIFDLGKQEKGALDLATSECLGTRAAPVQMVSYGPLPGQEPQTASGGFYRAEVLNLRYSHASGNIDAEGPGWVRGTMKTPPKAASDPSAQNNPLAGAASKPWTHLHLVFAQKLEGNADTGRVTAFGDVGSVVAGSDSSELTLDSQNRDTFPSEAFYLACDALTVAQTPDTVGKKAVEMIADGNALFRYDAYIGRGEHIKYSDAKKTVILEGDGLNSASIHRQEAPGAPSQSNRFNRGSFNLETKKIEADISSTTLDSLPGMK